MSADLVDKCLAELEQYKTTSSTADKDVPLDDFLITEIVHSVSTPTLTSVAERRALFTAVKARLTPSLQILTPLLSDTKLKKDDVTPPVAMSLPPSSGAQGPHVVATPVAALKTHALASTPPPGTAAAAAATNTTVPTTTTPSGVTLQTFEEMMSLIDDSPVTSPRNGSQHQSAVEDIAPLIIFLPARGSDITPVWTSRPQALTRFPSAAPAALGLEEPYRLYLQGERHLDNGKAWSEAPSMFEDAAVNFLAFSKTQGIAKLSKQLAVAMAGNCLVRAADCMRYLSNPDSAATSLVKAAEAYDLLDEGKRPQAARRGANAAMECAKLAAVIARKTGRLVKAAKLSRLGAEYAATSRCAEDAVKLLHFASALYLDSNGSLSLIGESRAALARAAAIAVMDGSDLGLAIDTLERLADLSTRPEQPLVLFRAALCRMACVPPMPGNATDDAVADVATVLDQYSNVSPELCGGRENECLKNILRGLQENEPQRVEAACQKYLDCHHGLEDWVEPLMRLIEDRSYQRRRLFDEAQREP